MLCPIFGAAMIFVMFALLVWAGLEFNKTR